MSSELGDVLFTSFLGVIGGIAILKSDKSKLKGYEEKDVNPEVFEKMIKLNCFIGFGMITLAIVFALAKGLPLIN